MIPLQFALRRRMMMAGGGGVPISDLPLGTLINVGTDGGAGDANYEIADINNFVSGGVVLVRKNIYSKSKFGSTTNYPDDTLDNLIKTTIYNEMPQKLRDKMMDVTFNLSGSGDITRKMFALTYTMAGFGNNSGVAEGKKLQLYTSNTSRVKTLDGSAAYWWLSSQHSSNYVWIVYAVGSASNYRPSNTYGVVPAFAIPSETPYDPTPNTDGSYNLILKTTISDLPLGALINIGTDGGAGTPNYEIADKDNLVSGGVVLVRKNAYSRSAVGGGPINYPDSILDNLIGTTIYNKVPQKLRDKMMDVSFALYSFSLSASENITRKMFAPTYTMVGFGNNHEVAEGVALQLYTGNDSRIKTFEQPNDYWRLSSQAGINDSDLGGYQWYIVNNTGTSGFVSGNSDYGCAVPAFVLPSDTPYNATPNTDGSYSLIL